jgi:hypothetical protein
MSGKKSKVIQFPTATRKKTDSVSLRDTTTEPSPSLKESKLLWPTIIGLIVGLLYVGLLFLL